MQYLKQSTAATVKLGPFVDSTDGFTAETGLTISQADIRLSKNGGAFAQSNNAAGANHDEAGYYDVPLNTTDTGTVGRLKVAVNESGALPAWDEFVVLSGAVYDVLFGTVAPSTHTAASVQALVAAGAVASVTNPVTAGTVTDKTGYALTSGERTAVANEVENQIIDDTDSEKVLLAITNKIASVNPSLSGLTLSAIGTAVWANGTRALTDKAGFGLADAAITAAKVQDGAFTAAKFATPLSPSDLADAIVAALGDGSAFSALAADSDLDAAKVILDHVATMIEVISGSNYRLKAAALTQAPSGGGGGSGEYDGRFDDLDATLAAMDPFPAGTVAASPAPTTIAFKSTGSDLSTQAGSYVNADNPRRVLFTSGHLKGQYFSISDHQISGSNHTFTVAAMPSAPTATDTFVVG